MWHCVNLEIIRKTGSILCFSLYLVSLSPSFLLNNIQYVSNPLALFITLFVCHHVHTVIVQGLVIRQREVSELRLLESPSLFIFRWCSSMRRQLFSDSVASGREEQRDQGCSPTCPALTRFM